MTRTPTTPTGIARAPGGWPLVGHAVALQRRPLAFLGSLAALGDLVEIRLGPRRAYVLCHPELAQRVLTDFRTFDRTGLIYDRVRVAMGNGLATAGHADHRRQRLIMQPAFRHEHLREYVTVMRDEITATMSGWRAGDVIDMVEAMFTLTTTVALRTLFSAQIGAEDAEELRTAFDTFLRGVYTRAALPIAGKIPTPGNRRYARALARWRAQVTTLIADYRRAGAARADLMSRLLAAHDDDGHAMSDTELSDQVAVILLAGGETTSAAVTWAWWLLSRHPDVLAALHAEVDSVLDSGVAGWEHLARLELTNRVVRETLRLYPPAWILPRTATHDTNLGGQPIPAGSMVVFSPYVLHRRPDLYLDPDRFDPDRWLTAAGDATTAGPVPRGRFVPFGGGATKCIGEDFANAETTLVLASIAARWDLRPTQSTVTPAARAVLVPKALPVALSARVR